jgi:hypothetical protein
VNFVDLALLLHDTTPPGIQPTHLSRTTWFLWPMAAGTSGRPP